MITRVLKTQFSTVVVFDGRGRKLSEYQGNYKDVKEKVLTAAPAETEFFEENTDGKILPIPREDW